MEMMVDEAKVAGLLSHANIVQILDLGNVDNQFYIAMEFVNGRDLGQVLRRCQEKGITLPVPHAVFLLIEMLKGLEYAHQRQVMRGGRPVPLNIVHRDISPGNVLVSFSGEVKLTDFGIAKASVKALETRSGVVKGRFDYMSPEQAAGASLDQRSDLFSAGVLFYEVLAGRHPFRQESEIGTIDAIRRGRFVPPSEVNPDVPYALDMVIEGALQVDPAGRLQTATAFKESLDRFFHDAGFIFSASTLANFVRGLFPEVAGPDRRNAVGDLPTRPLEPDEVELEPEESSLGGRQGAAGAASASSLAGAATVARPVPAGVDPALSGAPTRTLGVSRGPASSEEANPFEGEVRTLIRADPGTNGGPDTLRLALNPKLLEASGDVSTVIHPRVPAPQEAAPPPVRPALATGPSPSRTRSRPRSAGVPLQVHTAWMLVTLAAAVSAFVLGLLLGSRLHAALPSSSPSSERSR
jgi:serine/threonine-protein kinase